MQHQTPFPDVMHNSPNLFSDNSIPSLINRLRVELAKLPQESIANWLSKFDHMLHDPAKVDRACALLGQVQYNRRKQHELKMQNQAAEAGNRAICSDANSYELTRRAAVDCNRVLEASLGNQGDAVEAGVANVFTKIRKKSNCMVLFKTKAEMKQLQDDYVKFAAELYLRWGLTSRQYKLGRNILFGKSTYVPEDADVVAPPGHELQVLGAHRGPEGNASREVTPPVVTLRDNGLSTLVKKTFGLEVLPPYHTVIKATDMLMNKIPAPIRNIRERQPDGKFAWVKESKMSVRARKRAKNDFQQQEMVRDGTLLTIE